MEETSLDEFSKDIKNIDEYVKHIHLVESIVKENQNSTNQSLQMFNEHMKEFRLDKRIFEYKSIIISLYGILENFISIWIKEYINKISDIFQDYNEIPEKLSKSHFDLSIKLISILNENRYAKYNHLDKNNILTTLSSCINNPMSFNLNNEAFIPNSGNLSHKQIVEVFKPIDIDLENDLKQNQNFDNRELKELFEKINNLVLLRNDIAHGNVNDNILAMSEIQDYINDLKVYGDAIFNVLKEKHTQYELQLEVKNSYQEIKKVIKIFNSSILAFEASYCNIRKDDFIIVKTLDGKLTKKKILNIEINKIPYKSAIINNKINITVELVKNIKENQTFYIKERKNMPNILKAFINIVNNPIIELVDYYEGRNRINNSGKALEVFIQDAFAGTISEKDEIERLSRLEEVYSYAGNQNNPPDLILKNSDAIEVKKLQSKNTAIALNSSYPKAKLYANSPMITKACKECENWDIKDIIYTIGYTDDNNLKSLWLVYGDCFCADKEIYERIKDTISSGINTIPDVEFTQTNELGKVKKVDPLGITDLRIRGMWHIENPNKIFTDIYTYDDTKDFQLICLMKKEKYDSLPSEDKEAIENIENDNVEVQNIRIKNPNNPVQLIDAKLLVFKV